MRPGLTDVTDRRREIAERILRRVAELNADAQLTRSSTLGEPVTRPEREGAAARPSDARPRLTDDRELSGQASDEPGSDAGLHVEELRDVGQDAWDSLVHSYVPLIIANARRYPLSPPDVDDVVQTVLLRLVRRVQGGADLRDTRTLSTWLVDTSREEARRALHQSKLTRSEAPEPAATDVGHGPSRPDPSASGPTLATGREEALRTALDELEPTQRSLLLLLLVDPPIPVEEISAALGISPDRIGPMRADSLNQLRKSDAFRRLMAF